MMRYSKTKLSAIRLMIMAAFAFSVMAFCVKKVSGRLPSLEIVFIRSILGCIIILAIAPFKKFSLLGEQRKLLALRGLFGFIALTLHFYTITRLPLGTAVLLNYTAPLFVLLFSVIFFKEHTRPVVPALVIFSFLGVYLLIEGGVTSWNLDVFWGILSAIFASFAYLTIASLKRRESPYTVIFYFTAISTIGSSICLFTSYKAPTPEEWFYLFWVGLGSFFGQMGMTIALRRASASLVSPFSYLTPLLSFVYGLLFFNEGISTLSLLGAALIITGGCLLSHYGTLREKQKQL